MTDHLLTPSQVYELNSILDMGNTWRAEQPESGDTPSDAQQLAANTVDGVWALLPWRVSPFEDASLVPTLMYAIALHCRTVLETRGNTKDPIPRAVRELIKGYLVTGSLSVASDAAVDPTVAPVTPVTPGSGVSESRVNDLIESHRSDSDAHHTPATASGGLTESQVDAKIDAHRGISNAHHTKTPSVTPGDTSGLNEAQVNDLIETHKNDESAHHTQTPGNGVDQTARDTANDAQSAADTAQNRADGAFTRAQNAQTTATQARNVANSKDDAYPFATEGDSTQMPAVKHRLATSNARGAVEAAQTNDRVDDEAGDTTIKGWSLSHIVRLLGRKVKAFAVVGANTLIRPIDLFGTNHPNNRTVVVNTEGNFQLITGTPSENGGGGGGFATEEVGSYGAAISTDFTATGIIIPLATDNPWLIINTGAIIEEPRTIAANWRWVRTSDLLALNSTVGEGHVEPGFSFSRGDIEIYLATIATTRELLVTYGGGDVGPVPITVLKVVPGGTGGGEGGTLDLANIEPFAILGNTTPITTAKIPFSIPNWLSNTLTDIPFSKLNATLAAWTERGASALVPVNAFEGANRLLPDASGQTDGKIAKVVSGAWAVGDDEQGTGGTAGAKVWRFEIVNGTGVHATAVFIRLRYIDTYSDAGTRTSVQDLGNGYLTSTGARTISQNTALNIKTLLAQESIEAFITLVTSLPTPADANWGEWYGKTNNVGQVEGVYYRKEQDTVVQDWLVKRLNTGDRREDIHGYAQVVRSSLDIDVAAGGLYPSNENIVFLVEDRDLNDNIHTYAIVNTGGLLESGISIIIHWADDDGNFSTDRELPLAHDATYNVPGQRRYASGLYTDGLKFISGKRYQIKWRLAGSAQDLVINAAQHIERVADIDELHELRGEVFEEVYQIEDMADAKVTEHLTNLLKTPGGEVSNVGLSFGDRLLGWDDGAQAIRVFRGGDIRSYANSQVAGLITASIAEHTAISDAHHTPGTGGNGGEGTPLVLTKEMVTRVTMVEAGGNNFLFTTDNDFEAADTGIAVPDNTKTILLNYGANNTNAESGIDLPWFSVPIEEYNRLLPTTVGAGPTAATCRFTRTWRNDNISVNGGTGARQVWYGKLANGNIAVWTDNAAWDIVPFRVRFEVHTEVEVVTDATGSVVGGGGGGLRVVESYDAIQGGIGPLWADVATVRAMDLPANQHTKISFSCTLENMGAADIVGLNLRFLRDTTVIRTLGEAVNPWFDVVAGEAGNVHLPISAMMVDNFAHGLVSPTYKVQMQLTGHMNFQPYQTYFRTLIVEY